MKHEGNRLDYLPDNNPREFHRIFKRKKSTRNQLTTYDFFQYFKDVCNDNNINEHNPANDSLETKEPVFSNLIVIFLMTKFHVF